MVNFRIDVVVNPRGAQTGTRVVERRLQSVENRADSLRATLARAFAFIGVALLTRQLITLADTFTSLSNRIRLITTDTEQLGTVMGELFKIAERTRSSFEGTGELFARVGLAAKELGRSQKELLEFTESLNQAIILSGAAGQEARAGLIQLSQGLASGTLRGDELRSVLEQLPAVADVIAKELGITRGELRLLGEQGKITADIVLDAFKNAREELADRFATTIPTVSQSFEVLRTAVTKMVADFNTANGLTEKLSQGILFVADNLEEFARAAVAAGTALAVVFVGQGIKAAVRGLVSLSVALLTNPIFAIATLITASIAALVGFGDRIFATRDGVADLRDVTIAAFDAISQTVVPLLEGLGDAIALVFGGQFFTMREFAEAAAQTFDTLVGALRGTVLLINDLLVAQLGAVFDGSITTVKSFGLQVKMIFEGIANSLIDIFRDPVGEIARSFHMLLSSVAGAAAAAAALGLISEEARIGVEDNLASVERIIDRFSKRKEPVPIFDTDQTRKDIAELDQQASETFAAVGLNLKNAFLEGFDADTTLGFVKSIFDEAEENAKSRREAEAAAAREREAAAARGKGSLGAVPERPEASESQELLKLRKRIELTRDLTEQRALHEELLAKSPELTDAISESFDNLRLRALDASTDFEDGFVRAFIRIKQEAEDLAAVAEKIVNVFADRATDAIVQFAETGKFSFKEFASAILKDLLRIIVRLLIVQALNSAFGGVSGSSGTVNSGSALAGSRAEGGTVQPGRSFLVGENGPEIFKPEQTGSIIPNAKDQPQAAPEVNVQVVNVSDPNEIPAAIDDGSSDDAIINSLARNRDRVRQVVQ